MVTETAEPRALGEGSRPDSGKYIYYRRPDGTITIGPSWAIELTRRSEKGDTPLHQYGKFFETRDWNIFNDPYRRILKLGGAKEFIPQQIVELGWHSNPPYGVTFPQMEGVEVHEAKCQFCRKPFFSLEKDRAEANLSRHESISHKHVSDQQQLARTLATVISKTEESGTDSELARSLSLLAQTLGAMMKSQDEQGKRLTSFMEQLNKE